MGKISYVIYLYHNFVPLINKHTLNAWLDPLLQDSLVAQTYELHLLENLGVLLLLSWLSFELVENRFLGLKRYFEYSPKEKAGLSN